MNTKAYLEQLQIDKQTLVDNLNAKGVIAQSDETFTSLTPKVADIPVVNLDDYFVMQPNGTSNFDTNKLIKRLPDIDFSSYSSFYYAFNGSALVSIDLKTATNISTIQGMFQDCVDLVEVRNLDTSNVTGPMQALFKGCNKLTNIPTINTIKTKNLSQCFSNCYKLQKIVLVNTADITDMYETFWACYSLGELDISSDPINSACRMTNTFQDIPADCLIKVYDEASKQKVLSSRSDLTNVVVVNK